MNSEILTHYYFGLFVITAIAASIFLVSSLDQEIGLATVRLSGEDVACCVSEDCPSDMFCNDGKFCRQGDVKTRTCQLKRGLDLTCSEDEECLSNYCKHARCRA
ncbi:hypothetical protein HY490_03665 [Candidatus Woesearchaeota archaeon]|nr:hypothetical protein [Candidatus Woesearchaeota archaeon]